MELTTWVIFITLIDPTGKTQVPIVQQFDNKAQCEAYKATVAADMANHAGGWTLRSVACFDASKRIYK